MTNNFFDLLGGVAKAWTGTNVLQDPETRQEATSECTARFTPMLRGSFYRLDYTWAHQSSPEEGSMLIGHDPDAGAFSLEWIDTWHMSHKIMHCAGSADPGNQLVVRGHWHAGHETWGWRIEMVLEHGAPESRLEITMFNVTPDGAAELAVTMSLTPYAP